MPDLILASASPRRYELVSRLGVPFRVIPANIDEQHFTAESPETYVLRMARSKGQTIARQYPEAFVLGADTIVVCASQILGKPASIEEARQTLQTLSGRQHTVTTALALCRYAQDLLRLETVSTQVWFRALSSAAIDDYIATGEPFDKAGAYAIQEAGAAFVAAIAGCYTNVIGLPLQRTGALLQAVGFSVRAVSVEPPAIFHKPRTSEE